MPDCVLTKQNIKNGPMANGGAGDSNTTDMDQISEALQRHLVGVESLVYLSSVLEKVRSLSPLPLVPCSQRYLEPDAVPWSPAQIRTARRPKCTKKCITVGSVR